jgi:glycosyltransferase involved in cell wall biosynthesis
MSSEAVEKHGDPRFSVVIPAYNVQRYVARCLRSVLRQSYRPSEVLVYDDGSTDRTAAIVERFARTHPELRLIRQANSGQGAIRNRGIAEATGDHVLFVDSDDELDLRTLERCTAALRTGGFDFAAFRYQARYPGGARAADSRWDPSFAGRAELAGADTELLLGNRWLAPWQAAYRLDFVRANDLRNGVGYLFEDQEFTAGAIVAADRIGLVDAPLYIYHYNGGSSLRSSTDASRRRRIEGRRRSRRALVAVLERHGATSRGRALLAEHDLVDFVHEVVIGVYTEPERQEVLADVAEFLADIAPVATDVLDGELAGWYEREPADRDTASLGQVVDRLVRVERRRIAGSIAYRVARRVTRPRGHGTADPLDDARFLPVFEALPHRALRHLGDVVSPPVRSVVRGLRRTS